MMRSTRMVVSSKESAQVPGGGLSWMLADKVVVSLGIGLPESYALRSRS
jgi:hypothetical protein